MLDNGLTDRRTSPVNDIQYPWRQTGFHAYLGKFPGRVGCHLRRLGHYRAASSKRRSDLPAEQIQRKIPGRNATCHTHGLLKGVVEPIGAHQMCFALFVKNGRGVECKIFTGPRDVDGTRELDRFAIVPAFGMSQFFKALLNALGYAH
ncbi:MAG: Uncharacterised protein [Flavobacteriia bacterium]|nr:MAG: Uncharacterised protein [Flavobacteriia bacterium]